MLTDLLKAVGKGIVGMLPGGGTIVAALDMAQGIGKAIGGETGQRIQQGAEMLGSGLKQASEQQLTPEQQTAMRREANEHAQRMAEIGLKHHALDVEDSEGGRRLAMEEIGSEDEYVRRTRPGLLRCYGKATLWLVFGCVAMAFASVVIGGLDKTDYDFLIRIFQWALAPVMGTFLMMYRVYTGARSRDKQVEAGMQPEGVLAQAAKLFPGRK